VLVEAAVHAAFGARTSWPDRRRNQCGDLQCNQSMVKTIVLTLAVLLALAACSGNSQPAVSAARAGTT
jgi:hypothetical protein